MTGRNGSRVLLIGIDSAEVDYLEASLDRLPRLARLFAEGTVRRLASPGEVMSGSVWPTFYTGTLPGEHGQYFPMQWDPSTMRLRHVADDWLGCEPFWRPLAREGLPVITLDVQSVFPSRTGAGIEVVNWGVDAFGGFHCNRPELGREIARRFGTNVLGPDVPVEKSPGRLAAIRRDLLDSARRRGELARWLMRHTEWRLFLAVFTEAHRAGHYFWPTPGAPPAQETQDTLLEVHRAVDREVGALLDLVDLRETTVVVFSLLGMEPNRSQMHFVPALMDRLNAGFRANGAPPPRPRRSLMRLLRDRLPPTVQDAVARAAPEAVRDWVTSRAYASSLAWRDTPGLALPTGGEGYVRLNLAGREAGGCLPRGSELQRRYLDAVREGFLSLRVAGTNEPLVERILTPPELFPGPRSEALPDLAIAWRPMAPATAVHSERLGPLTARLQTGRSGNHRASAFAVVTGPARESPRVAALRSIVDLAHFVRDLLVGRA